MGNPIEEVVAAIMNGKDTIRTDWGVKTAAGLMAMIADATIKTVADNERGD